MKSERELEWEKICPPLYRATDEQKLPKVLVDAISTWEYGPSGMAFVGRSGVGKTRAMLLLLRRLFIKENRQVMYVTSPEFSHKVSRLSSEKIWKFDAYVGGLCRVPILLIDDVGKGRMTDRVQSEFFHVVETRVAQMLPIMFTAQGSSGQLAATMSEDHGIAIMRRLAEFCDVIRL